MTVIISGTDGVSDVDGTAGTPALRGTDANTGVFFGTDIVGVSTGGSERVRVDASGNVGIGTSTPVSALNVIASVDKVAVIGAASNLDSDADVLWGAGIKETQLLNGTASRPGILSIGGSLTADESMGVINFFRSGNTDGFRSRAYVRGATTASGTANQHGGILMFATAADDAGNPTERARITSDGDLLVAKTTSNSATAGAEIRATGLGTFTTNSSAGVQVNRLTSDGNLVSFFQDTSEEGTISVSGTTVSYNGGNLSRWAQLTTPKDDMSLFKGTVMSNLDEMNVYVKPTLYWTEDDELPVDEEGNPTVAVGDLKQETSVSENEQLNKVKVSDVEGDANVAGVFVNWTYDEAHQVDEINMAMTGDMIIRIAQGVTVARGDLLMSAGNGTAKPQGDDIVRSKTIAKVTSTHVTCTYDDGSYCVPCVLMAC